VSLGTAPSRNTVRETFQLDAVPVNGCGFLRSIDDYDIGRLILVEDEERSRDLY